MKQKRIILGILGSLILPMSVKAMDVSNWEELKTCLTNETDSNCYVIKDIAKTSSNDDIIVTTLKNLNMKFATDEDHSINQSGTIIVKGKNARLNVSRNYFSDADNGKVKFLYDGDTSFNVIEGGNLQISDSTSVQNTNSQGSAVKVSDRGSGFTFEGDILEGYYGVKVVPNNNNYDNSDSTSSGSIVIYGNIKAQENAIYLDDKCNGKYFSIYSPSNSSIKLQANGPAIYAGGYGNWDIGESDVYSSLVIEGIVIKSGYLRINGSTISEIKGSKEVAKDINGSALAILSTKDTTGKIGIRIEGGNLKANSNGYAILEKNIDREMTSLNSLDISNGNLSGKKTLQLESPEFRNINITGGTFSDKISTEYLNQNEYKQDENGKVIHYQYSISSDFMVDVKKYAKPGEKVYFKIIPTVGYEVDEIYIDGKRYFLKEFDNYFTMPDHNIYITTTIKQVPLKLNIEKSSNGTFTVNKNEALIGDEIIITPTPSDGYEVDEVILTYDNGMKTRFAKNDFDKSVYFTMPASNVKVEVTFKKIDTSSNENQPTSSETNNQSSNKPQDSKTYILMVDNAILETNEKLDSNYQLKVNKIEKSQEELNKIKIDNYNYLASYDINVLKENQKISIKNGSYTIKLKVNETYPSYLIGYINDNKVTETFDAKYENGYVVFTTTHLSEYAIYGKNNSNNNETVNNNFDNNDRYNDNTDMNNNNIENPQTGDNISKYLITFGLSMLMGIILIKNYLSLKTVEKLNE